MTSLVYSTCREIIAASCGKCCVIRRRDHRISCRSRTKWSLNHYVYPSTPRAVSLLTSPLDPTATLFRASGGDPSRRGRGRGRLPIRSSARSGPLLPDSPSRLPIFRLFSAGIGGAKLRKRFARGASTAFNGDESTIAMTRASACRVSFMTVRCRINLFNAPRP